MPDSAHGILRLILHRHFGCVICALLMWPPFFFQDHPYIWRTTIRYDSQRSTIQQVMDGA